MRGRLIVFLFNFQRLDRGHRPDRFRTVIQYCQLCYVVTSLYRFTIDRIEWSQFWLLFITTSFNHVSIFLKFIYTYENLYSFRPIVLENLSKISILSLWNLNSYLLLLFQSVKFETTIKVTITLLLQFLPILSIVITVLNLPFQQISLLHRTFKDSSLIFIIFATLSTIFHNTRHIDWIYSNNLRNGGFKRLWSQCQRITIDLKPVSHCADSFHIVRITRTVGKSRDTRRGDGRV